MKGLKRSPTRVEIENQGAVRAAKAGESRAKERLAETYHVLHGHNSEGVYCGGPSATCPLCRTEESR